MALLIIMFHHHLDLKMTIMVAHPSIGNKVLHHPEIMLSR